MTRFPFTPSRAAAAGFGAFAAASLLAGAVSPGYSAIQENVSALASAQAPHPWIMVLGFLALAASTVWSGVALRGRLAGRSGSVAAVLLLVAGGCLTVAAFARQDCSTALEACQALETAGNVSGEHMIHELTGGLSFVLSLVAGFLIARGLRSTSGAGRLATPMRVAALAGLVLLVVGISGAAGPATGLAQRAFVLCAFGMPLLVAVRLTATSAAIAGRPHAPVPLAA